MKGCAICIRSDPDMGGGIARTKRTRSKDGALAEVRDQLEVRISGGIERLAEWDLGPEDRGLIDKVYGGWPLGYDFVSPGNPGSGRGVREVFVIKGGNIRAESLEIAIWRGVEVAKGQAAVCGAVETADPDQAPYVDPGKVGGVVC